MTTLFPIIFFLFLFLITIYRFLEIQNQLRSIEKLNSLLLETKSDLEKIKLDVLAEKSAETSSYSVFSDPFVLVGAFLLGSIAISVIYFYYISGGNSCSLFRIEQSEVSKLSNINDLVPSCCDVVSNPSQNSNILTVIKNIDLELDYSKDYCDKISILSDNYSKNLPLLNEEAASKLKILLNNICVRLDGIYSKLDRVVDNSLNLPSDTVNMAITVVQKVDTSVLDTISFIQSNSSLLFQF